MVLIRRLAWDAWNIAHIARHAVTPDEVEEVCHNEPVVQQGKKRRTLVFGPTLDGRMLTVVLDSEGTGAYYPVTARPASRKERAIHAQERRGENASHSKNRV